MDTQVWLSRPKTVTNFDFFFFFLLHFRYMDSTSPENLKPDVQKHGPFYSLCQTLFYIFSFRHLSLLRMRGGELLVSWQHPKLVATENPVCVCVCVCVPKPTFKSRILKLGSVHWYRSCCRTRNRISSQAPAWKDHYLTTQPTKGKLILVVTIWPSSGFLLQAMVKITGWAQQGSGVLLHANLHQ